MVRVRRARNVIGCAIETGSMITEGTNTSEGAHEHGRTGVGLLKVIRQASMRATEVRDDEEQERR